MPVPDDPGGPRREPMPQEWQVLGWITGPRLPADRLAFGRVEIFRLSDEELADPPFPTRVPTPISVSLGGRGFTQGYFVPPHGAQVQSRWGISLRVTAEDGTDAEFIARDQVLPLVLGALGCVERPYHVRFTQVRGADGSIFGAHARTPIDLDEEMHAIDEDPAQLERRLTTLETDPTAKQAAIRIWSAVRLSDLASAFVDLREGSLLSFIRPVEAIVDRVITETRASLATEALDREKRAVIDELRVELDRVDPAQASAAIRRAQTRLAQLDLEFAADKIRRSAELLDVDRCHLEIVLRMNRVRRHLAHSVSDDFPAAEVDDLLESRAAYDAAAAFLEAYVRFRGAPA